MANSSTNKKDNWGEMIKDLLDPQKAAERRRKAQIKKRIEDKKKDAGL